MNATQKQSRITAITRLFEERAGLRHAQRVLAESIEDKETDIRLHLALLYPEARKPVAGDWPCPSALKTCVYDDIRDPCHDQCLECGDPEERK